MRVKNVLIRRIGVSSGTEWNHNSWKSPWCIIKRRQLFPSSRQLIANAMHYLSFAACPSSNTFNHVFVYYRRREEQRSLALEQRRARLNGGADNSSSLGQLEPGWGYFPSLAALQFQGSIPPPSRSVAEFELRERQRLTRILFIIATIVFTYFLIS